MLRKKWQNITFYNMYSVYQNTENYLFFFLFIQIFSTFYEKSYFRLFMLIRIPIDVIAVSNEVPP